MKPIKVLILAPYPISTSPSQRFRFEQYLDILKDSQINYHLVPFYNERAWKILHQPGYEFQKVISIIFAFFNRFLMLPSIIKYDYIFIHREVAHIGPPIFEWIIAKVLRKKIIYDFDDAIWLPNYSESNKKFHLLKYYKKVNKIISWSYKVSVGNEYLANHALQYNNNVIINPTTIDTETYHNANLYNKPNSTKIVIGWTGTHSTEKYLKIIEPILQELENKYEFEFCVISNKKPDLNLKSLHFVKWNKSSEIQDLMRLDVGVMPLHDDEWSKGKCGFKAIQYMSLGIPAIISPVGVNKDIVDNSLNGFICNSQEEWRTVLSNILNSPSLLDPLKQNATKKIVDNYSVTSNKLNFLSLFS